MFVYCGNDPIDPHITIPRDEYESHMKISLKVRKVATSIFHDLISDKKATENDEDKKKKDNKCRWTKERKIGKVIEKVSLWRWLYNGFYDNQGKFIKMSLEEAAKKVGISKKSLDDYLLQIRFGRKFGFNFNEHIYENVGVLRTFVKK